MKNIVRAALGPALAFFLFTSAPAWAELFEAPHFSAEAPKGWSASQEDDLTLFQGPEDDLSVSVIVMKGRKEDLREMAAAQAGQSPLRFLGDGYKGFIYEDFSGARAWGNLYPEGDSQTYCEIGVSKAWPGLADFLKSLRPRPEPQLGGPETSEGLSAIFYQLVSSPEILDWLNFKADLAAYGEKELPAEVVAKPYQGHGLTADLPEGWSAAKDGEAVVFSGPLGREKESVTVHTLPLNSDDDEVRLKEAAAFLKKNKIGVSQLEYAEGVLEFAADGGRRGVIDFYPDQRKAVILVYTSISPSVETLLGSIKPEGAE